MGRMTVKSVRQSFFAILLAMTIGGSAGTSLCSSAGQESSIALDALKLGLGAMEKGDFDSALGHYGRALEAAEASEIRFQALLGMGSAYAGSDRLDDAVAAYRAALGIKPDDAAALYSLGLVTKDQGRYEEAAKLFANAAVRDPRFGEALVQLGIVYEHLGRHEDALEACRQAETVLDDDEAATLCVAVALFQMGLYAEAIQGFEKALELNPGNPRAHYGLGLAKHHDGDRDGAIAEVGELNTLDPDLANDLYERIFPP
jgi:tetratricopeptide (TPR) repeat protein